ncbi:hypothetical protein ABTZ98_19160, partial [Streptomyces bacillaris]
MSSESTPALVKGAAGVESTASGGPAPAGPQHGFTDTDTGKDATRRPRPAHGSGPGRRSDRA